MFTKRSCVGSTSVQEYKQKLIGLGRTKLSSEEFFWLTFFWPEILTQLFFGHQFFPAQENNKNLNRATEQYPKSDSLETRAMSQAQKRKIESQPVRSPKKQKTGVSAPASQLPTPKYNDADFEIHKEDNERARANWNRPALKSPVNPKSDSICMNNYYFQNC